MLSPWPLFSLCKPFVPPTPTPVLPASFQQPWQDHLSICAAWGSPCLHWYDCDRWRKVGCRGRRKHHLRVPPSASCKGRKDNKEEVTFSLHRNHCENEPLLLGGEESSHNPPHYFLSSILPLLVLSNWPLGPNWPLKQVSCGLAWISDLH